MEEHSCAETRSRSHPRHWNLTPSHTNKKGHCPLNQIHTTHSRSFTSLSPLATNLNSTIVYYQPHPPLLLLHPLYLFIPQLHFNSHSPLHSIIPKPPSLCFLFLLTYIILSIFMRECERFCNTKIETWVAMGAEFFEKVAVSHVFYDLVCNGSKLQKLKATLLFS